MSANNHSSNLLIRDNPSFRTLIKQSATLSAMKQIWRTNNTIASLLNLDKNVDYSYSTVDKLLVQIEELTKVPDQFNEIFAKRGWIIYESMDFIVAKNAIFKAHSADIIGAEADLVSYYCPTNVKTMLNRMHGINAFLPRMALAKKALIDYENERNHACIPVILALLDGLVNEINMKKRGFFSENVDLTAWDSIAAHSNGLGVLVRLLSRTRFNTTTETIDIPYRNGTMHGTDLGYDNQMVAAKTWATLFAVREWALKAEKGLLNVQPEDKRFTWNKILDIMRENAVNNNLLSTWSARSIAIGTDIPEHGSPDEYAINTPEQKIVEFLYQWKANNYGFMAQCISPLMIQGKEKMVKTIRKEYTHKKLLSYRLKDIIDISSAVTHVIVEIEYESNGICRQCEKEFRLLCEDEHGNCSCRGNPNSGWKIISWTI